MKTKLCQETGTAILTCPKLKGTCQETYQSRKPTEHEKEMELKGKT